MFLFSKINNIRLFPRIEVLMFAIAIIRVLCGLSPCRINSAYATKENNYGAHLGVDAEIGWDGPSLQTGLETFYKNELLHVV